jgi:hypothetical protein
MHRLTSCLLSLRRCSTSCPRWAFSRPLSDPTHAASTCMPRVAGYHRTSVPQSSNRLPMQPASRRQRACLGRMFWIWQVDSDAFDRPFCTVSLLSAQEVVFGDDISGAAGEWAAGKGGLRLRMPVGSVLRVDGRAANPCKHALPRATSRRISLTFRRVSVATRARFLAIHVASREAAIARRARRLEAKMARGWQPPGGKPHPWPSPSSSQKTRSVDGESETVDASEDEPDLDVLGL